MLLDTTIRSDGMVLAVVWADQRASQSPTVRIRLYAAPTRVTR